MLTVEGIVSVIVVFLVKQIDQVGHSIKWEEVSQNAVETVAKIVPGEIFDSFVSGIAAKAINVAKELLQDEAEMEKLVFLCIEKKWDVAVASLKEYVMAKMV